MLRLIKKLLNISSNQSGESYLQVLESGDKKISFVLHMSAQHEAEQMLVELIQIKHTKNCQILAYHAKENILDIIVEVCFSSKKKNTQEVYKVIVDILNQEQEIKDNGKGDRES